MIDKIDGMIIKTGILIIMLFAIVLSPSFLFAQEEEEIIEETTQFTKEEISISQLAGILNSSDTEIIISDYIITNTEDDSEFMIDKVFFTYYEISPDTDESKKVYFYNCDFNIDDSSPLSLVGFTFSKLNIIGCNFNNPFLLKHITKYSDYPIIIENCVFNSDLIIETHNDLNTLLELKNNKFLSVFDLKSNIEKVSIVNCQFIAGISQFEKKDDEKQYYQLDLSSGIFSDIELINNNFDNSKLNNVFSVNMFETESDNLYMYKNKMEVLNLSYAETGKSLLIDSLFVNKYIGIQNFDFPETNTNIPWYNLGDEKLSIFIEEENYIQTPYQAKTSEQLSDNLLYNDLISAYTKFNTLYHDRGDITSANASYVEIKDIETRRQAFIQTIDPSLNNYINYQLNRFLKFFSDYATNPGKSLKLSLWVILIFTLLYSFSFYRWDGMNYAYYVNQFNKFYNYISTDKSIDEIFELRKNEVEEDIEELRNKYLASDKKVPKLLWLFGNPLHFLGKFRYKMIPNLIKLFNFQPGSWSSLNSFGAKLKAGTLIFLITLFYLMYIIVVKLLNSFILSVNSFFVIGFGALPEEEEGIAMYLSIIEGIIGWFLLTIFTITLLSQVLQNA
jgi:hypothetical protein